MNTMFAPVWLILITCRYLSERGNRRLLSALSQRGQLRPGTRVISNFFPVEGWGTQLVRSDTSDAGSGPLHLYRVQDVDGGPGGEDKLT